MPAKAHEYMDDSRGPRLQKVLAEAGVGSRRACEELIESGAVEVNDRTVATLPAWVDPAKDVVTVNGQRVRKPERHVYVMLFKPRRVVCTNDDPEGRTRVIDLVHHPSGARLYPVGRLDAESSGLVILTNDGEFANRLTHPRYGVHKTYEVTVAGSLTTEDVAKLSKGLFLPDRRRGGAVRTQPSRLKLLQRDRTRTRMRMELREGRNRQLRRMLARLGHGVKKLRRIEMGPLKLKGLRVGEWRELTQPEIASLRRAAAGKPEARPKGRPKGRPKARPPARKKTRSRK